MDQSVNVGVVKTQKGITCMKTRKVMKKKRPERPEREKPRFCDPAACFHCKHTGEGTFVCTRDAKNPVGVVVVKGWDVTEKYLYCKRQNDRRWERR